MEQQVGLVSDSCPELVVAIFETALLHMNTQLTPPAGLRRESLGSDIWRGVEG